MAHVKSFYHWGPAKGKNSDWGQLVSWLASRFSAAPWLWGGGASEDVVASKLFFFPHRIFELDGS